MKKITILTLLLGVFSLQTFAQEQKETKQREPGHYNISKFKQLDEELPTPNAYRTASGAPGHEYYQQQADYKMDII